MQYEFYFDAIQDKLIRAVAWRQTVAARHPGDPRNLKAARELSCLAKSRFADVTPETWCDIAPLFESDDFTEAMNLAIRAVGFRNNPSDMNAFIRSIVKAAPLTKVAA